MVDVEPGSVAVELPCSSLSSPGSFASRARRHRSLTGLSGILLFACMFLPAVKGCHEPVMPYEVPPFLPPYVYGVVFSLIAMAWSPRGLALGVIALRGLAVLMVAGSVVLTIIAPVVAVIELMIGAGLIALLGVSETSESRIAASGIAVGLLSTIWFGLWSMTPDALVGVYLSLASSIGLFAGSIAWLRELVRRPPVDVPRAVAHRARLE